MDEDDIRRSVSALDAAIEKQGAQLLISCDDDNVYCEFVANKAGYLRAGIELLRAAVEPLDPGDFVTSTDLNYLVGKRGLLVKRLTRRDDVEAAFQPIKRKATWKQGAAGVGCVTLLVCLVGLTLIGLLQLVAWIFGK